MRQLLTSTCRANTPGTTDERALLDRLNLHLQHRALVFDLAARAGFDGIELMVDHRWDTRQPVFVRQLSAQHDLPVLAVHAPFADVPGWPSGQPALIRQSVELAEQLGARVVVHHLPVRVGYVVVARGTKRMFLPVPGINDERVYRCWLEGDYAALQQATDVTLCIENMPARRFLGRRINAHTWNSPDEITRFPSLTMDTTHLGTWGLEPQDVYAQWRDKVRHIHLSNFDGQEHRLPQQGDLQLDALLQSLTARGLRRRSHLRATSRRSGRRPARRAHCRAAAHQPRHLPPLDGRLAGELATNSSRPPARAGGAGLALCHRAVGHPVG